MEDSVELNEDGRPTVIGEIDDVESTQYGSSSFFASTFSLSSFLCRISWIWRYVNVQLQHETRPIEVMPRVIKKQKLVKFFLERLQDGLKEL